MTDSKRKPLIPWRYLLFTGLCLLAAPLSFFLPWFEAIQLAFDIAALGYFATLPSLFRLDVGGIRKEAERVDPDRELLLVITAAITLVIVVSIITVLTQKQSGEYAPMLLCLATLVLAWGFTQMVYTFHYAHLYYNKDDEGDRKGLDFPGNCEPDYRDFAYFALTIGMTSQTSDVTMTGKHMRKIVTAHSLGAFAYNLGVMGFIVNTVANL
jgi:uncharacterized membrane protein